MRKTGSDRSAVTKSCPDSAEKLREAITHRYGELSRRLQQVAQYVIDHPSDMAVETLAVIAERSRVQPSTIVRFAKEFGYQGASEMQRLFRDKLLDGRSLPSYQERVRDAKEARSPERNESFLSILNELAEHSIVAFEHLHEAVTESDMQRVAELIDKAGTIYVTARRRTFPVAASIAYTLLRFGKRTVLIDGVAGFESVQTEVVSKDDLLIAITHQPYAPETLQFAAQVAEHDCKVVAITDSPFSPIMKIADVAFIVNEAEVGGFRSLSVSTTLAQALLLGYAFHRQRGSSSRRRPANVSC